MTRRETLLAVFRQSLCSESYDNFENCTKTDAQNARAAASYLQESFGWSQTDEEYYFWEYVFKRMEEIAAAIDAQ